jgi:transposase-like protein
VIGRHECRAEQRFVSGYRGMGAYERPSYARHRFQPAIIQHAVWLYFRLSYRDVKDLLAEPGFDASESRIRKFIRHGSMLQACGP